MRTDFLSAHDVESVNRVHFSALVIVADTIDMKKLRPTWGSNPRPSD